MKYEKKDPKHKAPHHKKKEEPKHHKEKKEDEHKEKHYKKTSSKGHPFKGDTEKNPKVKKFIEKRMHEFKEGEMHSRVKKTGPVVSNPKQAIAIALSESRKKGAVIKKKKK